MWDECGESMQRMGGCRCSQLRAGWLRAWTIETTMYSLGPHATTTRLRVPVYASIVSRAISSLARICQTSWQMGR